MKSKLVISLGLVAALWGTQASANTINYQDTLNVVANGPALSFTGGSGNPDWFLLVVGGVSAQVTALVNGGYPDNVPSDYTLSIYNAVNPTPSGNSSNQGSSGVGGLLYTGVASVVSGSLAAGSYLLDVSLNGPKSGYAGTVSAVPVPAAALLFGSGLVGLAGFGRRKEKTQPEVAA